MSAARRRGKQAPAGPTLWSRILRMGTVVAVVAAVSGAGFFAWQYRDALPRWPEDGLTPVQRVVVEGPFEHVTTGEVEDAVLPHLTGSFFTVDLGAIKSATEALSWVARAQVRREWPDSVHIVVTEERAAWLWGADALLNERAEPFVRGVQNRPQGLPRLDGPEGSERAIAQRYLDLDHTLSNCAMRIARMEVDGRRAWRATLDGGLVLHLGRQDAQARASRFCDVVLVALAARLQQVAYVDMRYTNGFAVGWRVQGG